ncbi:VanZ family protein [Amycolatopsis thermoflava]|uniref:VanZ family protein n=1 Tax=Amycolatopsis thermoflava TaxID=84480 RepID=UPI0038113FF2
MRVFGAHVPVSGWTMVVLVVGGIISVLLAAPLARRRGWRRDATLITLLLLTAVASVTLTPGDEPHTNGVSSCLPDDLADFGHDIVHSGGGVAADLLNLLLLLPLAGAVVVTFRRILPAVSVAILLPTFIELAQVQIPGRFCSLSDLAANVGGGLIGVVLGRVALGLLRRRSHRAAQCAVSSALADGPRDSQAGGGYDKPDQHVEG